MAQDEQMKPPPLPSEAGDLAFRVWVVGELQAQRGMLEAIKAQVGSFDLRRSGAITALIVTVVEVLRMFAHG